MAAGGSVARHTMDILFQANKQSINKVSNDARALKNTMKKLLGAVGVSLSIAGVAKVTKDLISAAAAVEELNIKFDKAFGKMSGGAERWANSLADSTGRARSDIRQYLLSMKGLTSPHMEEGESDTLSAYSTRTALDIGAEKGMDDSTAITAMQNAIKGEDAALKALGVTIDDNILKQAMLDRNLRGTFDDLDEGSKMWIRYELIAEQTQDAVGKAAAQTELLSGKQMKLNSTMQNVKELFGGALLPFAKEGVDFLIRLAERVQNFAESLGDASDEGSKAHEYLVQFREILAGVENGIVTVVNVIGGAVDAVGGIDNAVKILIGTLVTIKGLNIAASIANIVGSMSSASAAASGVAGVVGAATGPVTGLSIAMKALGAVFAFITSPIGIAIAAVVAIIAAFRDFFNFMNGKDSFIGGILERFGVDTDALREKISAFGEKAKEVFSSAVEGVKSFAAKGAEGIKAFASDMANGGEKTRAILGEKLGALGPIAQEGFDVIIAKQQLFKDLFTGNWSAIGGDLSNIFSEIVGVADSLLGGLPSKALKWASDMMANFKQGILDAKDGITGAVSDAAGWISSKLKHSVPKEGPLKDDDKWTLHMMQNLEKGIRDGGKGLYDRVSSVARSVKEALNLDGVQALYNNSDATGAAGRIAGTSTQNISIVQNNSFSNSFNGTDRENQKRAASQMDRNARDATGYLANALAYGR